MMRTEVDRSGFGKQIVNMSGDGVEVLLSRELMLDVKIVEVGEGGKYGREGLVDLIDENGVM
jgi:hypothetical protein